MSGTEHINHSTSSPATSSHATSNHATSNSPIADHVADRITDVDELEVVDGTVHEAIEGWIPELASDDDIRTALEKAFDYRGDVTITRKDGTKIEGYVFDRRAGATLQDSAVRVLPTNSTTKLAIPYSDIAALAFTGRDTAAGKTFEAWMKKYWEKKAAGEKSIGIEPEALD